MRINIGSIDELISLLTGVEQTVQVNHPRVIAFKLDVGGNLIIALCRPYATDEDINQALIDYNGEHHCPARSLQRITTPNFPNGDPNPHTFGEHKGEPAEVRMYLAVHFQDLCREIHKEGPA